MTCTADCPVTDRSARLCALRDEAAQIMDEASEVCEGYEVTAIVGLFSGGNDSTVLSHMFRDVVTHFGHANTQVGAEPTRQFVRDTSRRWGVPLLEEMPLPGYGYEDLILRQARSVTSRAKYPFVFAGGFPGPSDHQTFFGYLKDRALRKIRGKFNDTPTRQRVIYIDGRRKDESAARTAYAKSGRLSPVQVVGSVVRVSPLINWSKLDMNQYRRENPDVPRNETADLMHMSMECACGCYSHENEMSEVETWLPGLAEYLHELEWKLRREDLDIDPRRLTWGWHNGGKCASGICNT